MPVHGFHIRRQALEHEVGVSRNLRALLDVRQRRNLRLERLNRRSCLALQLDQHKGSHLKAEQPLIEGGPDRPDKTPPAQGFHPAQARRSRNADPFGQFIVADASVVLQLGQYLQVDLVERFAVDDRHGNLLSLFERECTLQRRHQKVIEEAPSPTLNAKQRETVCEAARKAAGAVNYVGAGTIEFVSDGKDVFFIEMNTRLQVEHPVTELITGIDLVEWQLRVAFGEKLPLTQDQIKLNGHAIEARVYAENPHKNFMPSVGRIKTWRTPAETDGLRIDAGYQQGSEVSPHYDAMLAKVIAWAPSRDAAISRLNRGLEETDVRGVVTNIPFLAALVTHPDVRKNAIDTGFIERHLQQLTPATPAPSDLELAAAVAAILDHERDADQQEDSSLVLPIGCAMKEAACDDAVAQDRASGDQSDGCEHNDEVVANDETTINRRDKRIVCRGGWEVVLVQKRAVHQAGTSLASFNRLAATADFLP